MSKLIQLKLSEEKIRSYNEIVDLLGLKGTYGEYQKAIDFSITFTIESLKESSRVLPNLDSEKLDLWLSTIKKLKKEALRVALLEKAVQNH